MYDRYTITASKEALEKTFQVNVPEDFVSSFNASPTHLLPVIIAQEPKFVQLFQWGLISSFANNKALSPKLINLQSSLAFNRPVHRKTLMNNRCVILADGFYAWKQVSKKQRVPYFFYFNKREPFGIAGIWEESDDLEGNVTRSFNMMTVEACGEIKSHQNDMPAILKAEEIKTWLGEEISIKNLEALIKNIEASGLNMHPVSHLLSNPALSDERLIKPAPPSDQFGNYTLFS